MDTLDIKLGAVESVAVATASVVNAGANVPAYYEHGVNVYAFKTSDEVRKASHDAVTTRAAARLEALRMKHYAK
jgi:hypothetical protein